MNIEKLIIPANYVLVKTEDDYETYQLDGRDTGIRNPLSMGTAGQRISIFGTVIKVPETNSFYGAEIKSIRKNVSNEEEAQSQVDYLKKRSLSFDTPMELQPGNKVTYLYKNQIDCYKENRVLHTDQGVMMMMRYDTIGAIVRGEDELYPLNGALFIEAIKMKSEDISPGGIHRIEQTHMGQKIKHSTLIGRIVECGCLCSGYTDFPEAKDTVDLYKKGDYIYYDGRMSRNLQYNMHQTMKTPRVVIYRKDIYGSIPDPTKLEFAN